MAWLKLHTDIIDDEKMLELQGEVFKDFIMLLSYAAELKNKGIIQKTNDQISWRLRIPVERIEIVIARLLELKIITLENGVIRFTNWEKRQFDKSYLRVKKHRLKHKRNENVTGIETPLKRGSNAACNTLDNMQETINTDTDTDTEADVRAGAREETVQKSNGFEQPSPAKIIFDYSKKILSGVTDQDMEHFSKTYPHVDVTDALQRFEDYCIREPEKTRFEEVGNERGLYNRISRWLNQDERQYQEKLKDYKARQHAQEGDYRDDFEND